MKKNKRIVVQLCINTVPRETARAFTNDIKQLCKKSNKTVGQQRQKEKKGEKNNNNKQHVLGYKKVLSTTTSK